MFPYIPGANRSTDCVPSTGVYTWFGDPPSDYMVINLSLSGINLTVEVVDDKPVN